MFALKQFPKNGLSIFFALLLIKKMSSNNKKESQRLSNRKKQQSYSPQASKNVLFTACAFHPSEKITNFCTNKQCLLPLCPKCVKIHTDQHIKMGVFGEFNTIEASFHEANQGLKSISLRLDSFQRIILDLKRQYDEKKTLQIKIIRDAKSQFLTEISRIFESYERAMLAFQEKENKQFFNELYTSQELLVTLSEHFEKATKRLSSSQNILEGIINYYSQAVQAEKVVILAEKLQKLLPQPINIRFYPSDLQRLQSMIKRYIDAGRANEEIWKQRLSPNRSQRNSRQYRRQSPLSEPKKYQSPIRRQQAPKNSPSRVREFNTLESNLNLARFKSPLENFSLARLRNYNER